MFNKNQTFLSSRVILVFILAVGIFGVTPSRVNADAVDGSISGIVYMSDGVTPIANIYVSIRGNGYNASTCTNASGQFAFPGLPFGVQFQIQASPPWANCGGWSNYVQEFWQETRSPNSANLITLDAQNPDRTDINFTLDAGGVISGTVHAADGVTPLQHIAVSFQDEYITDYNQSVCTDANGHYEFHGAPFDMPLIVSTYAYHDNWCNAGGNYISEFWQESPDLINASLVTVTTLSPSKTDVDFTLDSAGSISGKVYEADGVTPIPNIPISIFGNNYFGESPSTDSLGNYTIHNVPFGLSVYLYAGDASQCVGANSHAVEFWSEASSLTNASLVSVSAQTPDLTGADFTLDSVPCASSDPWMRAWYMDDVIEADDWPIGSLLKVEIEDMTTPISPDYSTEIVITESITWLDLSGQFDIKPGMFVVLSGASMSRIVKVDNLTITNIDQDLDTISGTTSPTYWLWMWFGDSSRSTVANKSGIWMMDFSVPGPEGQPAGDIGAGSEGAVHVPSGGGSTSVAWRVPTIPYVQSITLAGTSPASASSVDFSVIFSEDVTDVDTSDFTLTTTGVTGSSITSVTPISGTIYTVKVDTGSGNGTIRLDVVDNNSILNASLDPLGGAGVGDGDFTGGETYDIEKTAPTVVSSMRVNPSPTNLANVDFTVTFSEPVTGVDPSDFILTTTGAISGVTVSGVSGSGSSYTVTVNTGSNNGSIRLNVADNNSIMDGASNLLGGAIAGDGNFTTGEVYTVIKSATFADVPLSYWSNSSIERLYNAGITGGCSAVPLNYCPTTPVTRAQMAIFLLRGMHGSAYTPPAATGTVFTDVPLGTFGAAWIEQLATEGITSGCGGGNYCPTQTVSRAQMAIFLVRAKHGVSFVPPTATGIFPDVPVGSFGANYIEQLVADAITSGCGGGLYCPNTMVKRDSMAVFLVKTFNLP